MNGQLAVSRAFGDKNLKTHLRSDPDIQYADINPDIELLILASDGLWKVFYQSLSVHYFVKAKPRFSTLCHRFYFVTQLYFVLFLFQIFPKFNKFVLTTNTIKKANSGILCEHV